MVHFDWKTNKALNKYSELSARGSLTLGVDRYNSIETLGSGIESSTFTIDQFHSYLALRILRVNLPYSTNSMRREDRNFSHVVHVTGVSEHGENVSGHPAHQHLYIGVASSTH